MNLKYSLSFWIIITFLLLGCKDNSVEETGKNPLYDDEVILVPIDTSSCEDGAELSTDKFILSNNVWGKGDIINYEQCIFLTKNDSALSFAWRWNWPTGTNNVKAYPEIVYGRKPFGNKNTARDLPKRIDSLSAVLISFGEISTEYNGSGNFAFDIWITNSPTPNRENIKHELMIWLENKQQQPAGTFVEKVKIGNDEYNFYAGNIGWNYFAFIKVNQDEINKEVDVKAFLNYLEKKSYIIHDEFISSIEFGNEIISGKGQTIIKNYKVLINK